MLEQLDLFSALTQEPQIAVEKPRITERKLIPPSIVELKEREAEPEPFINAPAQEPETITLSSGTEENNETSAEPLKRNVRGRKSQKEMSLEVGRIDVPEDETLFNKQYYGIGEVAAMFSVNTSLLRYWESEFDILKPRKNRKGDRFFRPEDIKNLQLIHHLLRERKYTIEGAKDFLKNGKKAREHFEAIEKLKAIKKFLLEIKAGL